MRYWERNWKRREIEIKEIGKEIEEDTTIHQMEQ